jgi:hypothetical protein
MEEYKQFALSLKDQGNTAFQAGDNQLAIDCYTQASFSFTFFCMALD